MLMTFEQSRDHQDSGVLFFGPRRERLSIDITVLAGISAELLHRWLEVRRRVGLEVMSIPVHLFSAIWFPFGLTTVGFCLDL